MTKEKLSPAVQKVQRALQEAGLNCEVLEFSESTRTAEEAARCIGCQVGQIIKSLVFYGLESGKPILALTSGANRVDEERLAQQVGEPVRRAAPEFVRQVTGFAIGGVPPLGHVEKLETYIDEDLLQYPTLWAAAGTPYTMFAISPTALLQTTGGRVVALKQST